MNLAELSIKRPMFISCLVVLMLALGLFSFKSLSVDLFPEVTFPIITVTIPYPGAGPAEIETLITKPMEDEISTISGLKRLTSQSLEGISQIGIEFYLETDIKYAEQQVRDKVAIAKTKIPREAKEPSIRRMDPADQPILQFALKADIPEAKLYDLADQVVKNRLQQVNDVGLIDIQGGRKREIQIALDRHKLSARAFSSTQVANQIRASGENVPAGKIEEGKNETVFRSLGEFKNPNELEKLLVNLYDNDASTRVSDVGIVRDTLQDEKTKAFLNGKKSLFINVYRQSKTNTLAVVNGVKAKVPQINSEIQNLYPGSEMTLVRDGSKEIQDNVDDVKETIVLGVFLTVLVVFFFLANARSTFITGLALPNSLLGAFILMAIAGFSINVVSLLALSLSVGLLIDDAIVVRENIFRHLEKGEEPMVAAKKGTAEVQLAVIATTLVVCAVFGPVAFTKGMIGQFLKQFGLTVCFAMAISLFDALTIAPMLSAYFAGNLKAHSQAENTLWSRTGGKLLHSLDRFQTKVEMNYERFLRRSLRHPKTVLALSFLVFILASVSLAFVPQTFFPAQDMGEFVVNLDLKPGTNLTTMTAFAQKADEVVRANKEVVYTAMTVGGRNEEPNKAEIYINLVPAKDRPKLTTTQMKERIREQMKSFSAGNPQVNDYDPSGSTGTRQFQLRLQGSDSKLLEEYSQKLLASFKQDQRMTDVDTSYRPGKPEFQIKMKPDAAKLYGMSSRLIGNELRVQVEGDVAAKFRENGQEYDVRVRLLPEQRNIRENFSLIQIPNLNGKLVRLSDVAEGKIAQGPSTIDRQDRSRYIELSSDVASNSGLGDIMSEAKKKMESAELKLPPGIRSVFVGNSENFEEMGSSILLALGFAILFIYLVLTSLYESPITPLTIMLALPLALCGAFLALFIAGESMSLFSILGIILLLGVASKNSILIVDYAKHAMEEKKLDRVEAIIEAGKTRLRPILMTSFALIAGTIPVAIGLNEASKQRTSMGVAIIGGLISSTLLCLVVIPSAFLFIDRFREWFEKKFNSLRA